MRSVAFSEPNELTRFEIDHGVMDVIRILIGIDSHESNADPAFLLIDFVDRSDHPGARGERRPLAGLQIDQLKMVPPGSFGHPDGLVSSFHHVKKEFSGVIEKRGR